MAHGAGAAQALLRAGQLDELELHVVPILLGQGRRLLNNLPAERVELDLIRRMTTSDVEPAQHVMHLRYRVRRPWGGNWRRRCQPRTAGLPRRDGDPNSVGAPSLPPGSPPCPLTDLGAPQHGDM